MYVTVLFLVPPAEGAHVNDARLTDAFWAHAQPGDRLEHLHVRREDECVRLTLFTMGESQERSQERARATCRRILRTAKTLRNWRLKEPDRL